MEKKVETDKYVKAMFGENAVHTPLSMIVQDAGDKVSLCIAQVANNGIKFSSSKTHQFIMGDCIIRPRLVFESDRFKGCGIAAIATMDWRDWLDEKVILNPTEIDIRELRS